MIPASRQGVLFVRSICFALLSARPALTCARSKLSARAQPRREHTLCSLSFGNVWAFAPGLPPLSRLRPVKGGQEWQSRRIQVQLASWYISVPDALKPRCETTRAALVGGRPRLACLLFTSFYQPDTSSSSVALVAVWGRPNDEDEQPATERITRDASPQMGPDSKRSPVRLALLRRARCCFGRLNRKPLSGAPPQGAMRAQSSAGGNRGLQLATWLQGLSGSKGFDAKQARWAK